MPSPTSLKSLIISLFIFATSLNAQNAEPENSRKIGDCVIQPKTHCPGADLRHANLQQANLAGANLRGAKLARADLRHANLRGANLQGADLDGINGWAAFFQGAVLDNASLRGANLEFARFSGARLVGANMQASNLEMAWMSKVRLEKVNLRNANLQEAKFYYADFLGADLRGANIRYGIFQGARMTDCLGCPFDWQAPSIGRNLRELYNLSKQLYRFSINLKLPNFYQPILDSKVYKFRSVTDLQLTLQLTAVIRYGLATQTHLVSNTLCT